MRLTSGGGTCFFDLNDQTHTACLREIANPSSPQTVVIPSQITVNGKQYTVTELKFGSNYGSHPAAKNVTGLILPNTITTVNESCFRYFGLTSMTIPGSIKRFNGSFQYCDTLKEIIFEEGVEWIGDSSLTMLTDTPVESIHLPSTLQGFDNFAWAESLTEIELPANITTIPFEAFRGCTSLKRVVAKGTITEIGGSAFSDCKALEEIPDLSHVTTMGSYAFAECSSLTCEVDLSSLNEIPDCAFYSTPVKVSKLSGELTSIGRWAFIVSKIVPNNGSDTFEFPDTLTYIGPYAFWYGDLPKKVVLPDSVTDVEAYAFQASNVEEFDIGSGLREIKTDAFSSDGLKKITIDNSSDIVSEDSLPNCTVVYKKEPIPDDGDAIVSGGMSLQEAVNKAKDGEVITLRKNVTLDKTLEIPQGKNIIIRSDGEHIILAKPETALETLMKVEAGASVTFDGSVQLFGKRNSGAIIDCQGTVTLAGNARVYGSDIRRAVGAIEVHGKGAKLVMTGGEVAENYIRANSAPIHVFDDGKVSIQGGAIRNNKVVGMLYEASSGILVGGNGSAEMTGGLIENNQAYRGSAVTLYYGPQKRDKLATFVMSGGALQNNVCTGTESGGAVYVCGNASFTLKDKGVITKNQAEKGAGVCVLDPVLQTSGTEHRTQFIMEGGEISYNKASVGGGIYSFSNGVELKAGKICGNEAFNMGGGIYSEGYQLAADDFRNSTLHMTNAAIINNTSGNQGGGLWFCSTGTATVHVTNGAVIANNRAAGAGDDVVSVKANAGMDSSITLANRMLGGGKALWYQDGRIYRATEGLIYASTDKNAPRYGQAGADGTPMEIVKNQNHLALKAVADASAVQLAKTEAKLLIMNNQSGSRGGGVAANGGIVIGTEDKDLMDIPVQKTWDHAGNAENKRPVSVTVKLMRGQAVLETLVLKEENGWKGIFEDLPRYDDYTVMEQPIPNYTAAVSGSAGEGFTLSNVYHPTDEDKPFIPQTGDESRLLLWGALLVLALGGAAYLLYRKKKDK